MDILTKHTTANNPVLKIVAAILFIIFPIIGFVFGMQYQAVINLSQKDIILTLPTIIPTTVSKNEIITTITPIQTPTINTLKTVANPTNDPTELLVIARRLFAANLNKSKLSTAILGARLTDYTIGEIKIIPSTNNDRFCFGATYSVKPLDINMDFIAGNGAIDKSTGWINDKYAFVKIKKLNGEYIIDEVGTAGICD